MQQQRNNLVAVIGDADVDYHYRIAEIQKAGGDEAIKTFSKSTGGSAASTAMGLSVLGVNCAYCGCVGNDDDGEWILSEMKSVDLDISCVHKREQTGFVLALVDDDRERTMLSYRGQVDAYELTEELKKMLETVTVLHLSAYSLLEEVEARSVISAAKYAKEQGCFVSIDTIPNIEHIHSDILTEMMQYVDILFVNFSELCFLAKTKDYETAVNRMIEKIPCIGLKMGGAGAMVAIREGFVLPDGSTASKKIVEKSPVVPVDVVDTTGAGDGFNAGFLSAFAEKKPPIEWIKTGNAVAARVVGQKQARLVSM